MNKDNHNGHRLRMVERLKAGRVCEHEYLEALLYVALPRINTNPIAHRLLATFGDLRGVMEAPIDKLAEVKGVGNSLATFIHCVGQMMPIFYRVAKTERQCPKYFTRQEFSEFIKAEYANLPYEKFDAYLLDAENRIFDCKRFSIGADGKVRVDTEIFTREIVEAEPSGVVLVHNHPKGNCQPSMQDDTTTETCASICAFHNILLCDHLICAKNGVYSYYESGKLKKARSD